jgi:hypothetical protein
LPQNYSWTLLAWPQADILYYGDPAWKGHSEVFFTSDSTFNYPNNWTAALQNPIGTAIGVGTGDALIAYLSGETDTVDAKLVCYRQSTNYGQTFGPTGACPGANTTVRNGIAVGFDPRSSTFLIGYAATNRQLTILTVPATGSSTPSNKTTFANVTWDAPSIACRNATYGCRIAYEDASSGTPALKWLEAQVNLATGVVESSVTRTQGWTQYDTPSVVYFQMDNTYRLSYQQSNHSLYAASMDATGTSWSGMPDLWNSVSSFVSAPVVATERTCFFGCTGNLRGWFTSYW